LAVAGHRKPIRAGRVARRRQIHPPSGHVSHQNPIPFPGRRSAIVVNLQSVDGDSCRWPRPAATRGWC